MDGSQWLRVKALFEAALDQPSHDRLGWVERQEPDAAVVAEVLSLLSAHERSGSFIETPALSHPDALDALRDVLPFDRGARVPIGARLGAYEIISHVGDGGMGSVFLARRVDAVFEQQVAIKLVRSDLATPSLADRLRRERRILATLDHPNIARLIDGGSTDNGVPYAVMDYVHGVPIDTYCDTAGLTVRQRVELFSIVCGAVHYAHQRLVIHRDLKPSNILVTADGVPKLLDFGIAKLIEPQGLGTDRTRTGWRALTLESASPEQVRGQTITIASDVYALGVLLYRLLSGASPYVVAPTDHAALEQAICEVDPAPPSRRLDRQRRRALPSDLDLIVLKSLQKDPARRYASVAQLADDLARQLAGRPVSAGPDAWRYRARKFVRRHRVAVAATMVGVLSLVAGGTTTIYQKRAADRERLLAERRFSDVRKLANSMMFEFPDSIQNTPGTTLARKLIVQKSLEYLDVLAREAAGDLSLQRELATAYEKMGEVQGDINFANLGDSGGALAAYRKAAAIREQISAAGPYLIEDQLALADILRRLCSLQLQGFGDVDGALGSCRRAVAVSESAAAAAPRSEAAQEGLLKAYADLGGVQSGQGTAGNLNAPDTALVNHRKALALARQLSDRTPANVAGQSEVATLYQRTGEDLAKTGDRTSAMTAYQQAFGILERLAKNTANDAARRRFAVLHRQIGDMLLIDGKYTEALS